MSGLREALEKLAGELEYDVAGAPSKIRALLAAHPESVVRVSDEVLAEAMDAYYREGGYGREANEEAMRAALEAALALLNGSGVDSSLHTCPGCGVKVVGHERCGDPSRPECAS
ncbi:hypothetical protein [Kribbella sp. NPDC050470]|uniref:hypothetical protein n=1 Tax=unclassified Kribbella TaxID=2644121 RepID=UPI0037AC9BC9